MAKIDSSLPIQHVGDNRHSPLKIVGAMVHPYQQRSQEARKAEQQHPLPKITRKGASVRFARGPGAGSLPKAPISVGAKYAEWLDRRKTRFI